MTQSAPHRRLPSNILPFHPGRTAEERAKWTRIAVVESRWARRCNLSVRPMFENLCAAYGMGPDGFEYEMAASPAGLEEVAARLTSRERAQVLYLGCHGDETGELVFHSGERLSPNRLADLLAACGPSLRGLYLGACFAGRRRLARRAFDRCPQLRWVAGYRQEVDFVDSSLLDVMFFNRWLNSEAQGLRRVEEVVRDLARQMPGLLASQSGGLGFKVHVKGRDGEVRELVREAIRGD